MTRIVIVGASLAGAHAARAARRAGFDGELVVVGEEPHQPYDRPPLSKEFLVGDFPEERLVLRPTADPDELGLRWRLGRRAEALDLEASSVRLDDGEELAFDGLVVATGARPRRLPVTGDGDAPPAGLYELRTLDDARALRRAFDDTPDRVVVCGAGFIGAEVAASARERGLDVTMIDAAPAPLERVLDRAAGLSMARLHRDHGVEVRLEIGVEAIVGDDAVAGVALTDGSTIDAEVIVVGIGVVPNTEWLGDGLTIDDGVVADETCVVGPGIVAAGDVCRWPNRRFGGRLMRIEQWDNAVEMGGYAGARIAAIVGGGPSNGEAEVEPFQPVPWFWSDQYDRKIQLAGLAGGDAEVVQGGLDEDRLVQIYLDDDDRLQGALCWNRPRQAIVARQLIAAGESAAVARQRLGP